MENTCGASLASITLSRGKVADASVHEVALKLNSSERKEKKMDSKMGHNECQGVYKLLQLNEALFRY